MVEHVNSDHRREKRVRGRAERREIQRVRRTEGERRREERKRRVEGKCESGRIEKWE